MKVGFEGEIWCWRGPAPYFFVTVPEGGSSELRQVAGIVSYGWGMIPVQARIGRTAWKTSLFPKDGGYVLPLKVRIREAEKLHEGDVVAVQLEVSV